MIVRLRVFDSLVVKQFQGGALVRDEITCIKNGAQAPNTKPCCRPDTAGKLPARKIASLGVGVSAGRLREEMIVCAGTKPRVAKTGVAKPLAAGSVVRTFLELTQPEDTPRRSIPCGHRKKWGRSRRILKRG